MICTGEKISYDSKSDALVGASRLLRKPKRKGGDNRPFAYRAYRCSCGKWHLTKRVRGSRGIAQEKS